MSKSDSLQGSLDVLVLKILSRRPRSHGYAIMSAIKEFSDDVLSAEEGSLYPALHRMEEAGWVRSEWIKKDSGRRQEQDRWQTVTSAVNRVLRMV
jgi:PadR family transcriptional regulator, regulatory protein PadR